MNLWAYFLFSLSMKYFRSVSLARPLKFVMKTVAKARVMQNSRESIANTASWPVGNAERGEAKTLRGCAAYSNWTPLTADRLCRCLRDIKGVSIGVYFRIGNKSSIAVRGSWPCKLSVFLAFVLESCVRFVRVVMKEAENRINRAF